MTVPPDTSSAAPSDALVHARGLVKRFGDLVAVDGIDVDVRRGEVFGFLGPNGAGKSSTMRMVGCTSPRSGGVLRVLGADPERDGPAIRARLGVVPQEDTLEIELTPVENLLVYGRYFDLPRRVIRDRSEELLRFVQLWDRRDARTDSLSGGMKRRLTIARALVNRPAMVLLDEPTTGLDPQARHLVWERLHGLRDQGVTLVLTTHYMDEAEQLCDRLVVMDQGRIVAEGSPAALIAEHAGREVLELRFPRGGLPEADDPRLHGVGERVERVADRLLVATRDADASTATAHRNGLEPTSVLARRATLEDVFLRLTGRTLVE